MQEEVRVSIGDFTINITETLLTDKQIDRLNV